MLDRKETIRLHILTEPPSLDWNITSDSTSVQILDNISEGLLTYDHRSNEALIRPALATSWSYKEEGKIWIFKLRKNVRWTDGVEFRSNQVVDSWERLLNPMTASVYAYFLYDVKNARAYNEGKIKDFSQVGVKIKDPYTLEVELEKPRSFFPSRLTHHSTWPVRKDLVEKYPTQWATPKHIITLGAFRLKKWVHDKEVILERNLDYYGEKAKVKFIHLQIISDSMTAVNLFDKGHLDIVEGLPSNEIEVLKEREEFREISSFGVYYVGFNTLKAPTDDLNMRKAISYAIDRMEIVKLLKRNDKIVEGVIPEGLLGYRPASGIFFDLKKAKSYLSKTNYMKLKKEKRPIIKMMFNSNLGHQKIAENIQAQLKKNLNINLELRSEEWKVYLKTLQSSKATEALFRMGWNADFPDPDNFAKLFSSYSGNNHTGWKSEKYDQLVERAAEEIDSAKREKYYFKIQELLVAKEAVVFPIYSLKRFLLVSKRVKDYFPNSMSHPYFKGVYLKD